MHQGLLSLFCHKPLLKTASGRRLLVSNSAQLISTPGLPRVQLPLSACIFLMHELLVQAALIRTTKVALSCASELFEAIEDRQVL